MSIETQNHSLQATLVLCFASSLQMLIFWNMYIIHLIWNTVSHDRNDRFYCTINLPTFHCNFRGLPTLNCNTPEFVDNSPSHVTIIVKESFGMPSWHLCWCMTRYPQDAVSAQILITITYWKEKYMTKSLLYTSTYLICIHYVHNYISFLHQCVRLWTRSPGALMLCLVTCQIGIVRFMPNVHVATTYVVEVTQICVTSIGLWVINFAPFDSTTKSFRVTCHFETTKCTEWPQMDLEHYKVKGTPYMSH